MNVSIGQENDVRSRARAAIDRGLSFLADRQLPSGELPVRISRPAAPDPVHDPSIFASALIASALASIDAASGICSRACAFIEAQREPFGVWRHWTAGHREFHFVPPDVDDTSVACIALRAHGRPIPDNRALLLANRDRRSGLFFSWISLRPHPVANVAYWWISLWHLRHAISSITFYFITPSERDDIDAVVNANALFYLGRSVATEPVISLLLDVLLQERENSCDKWYENPFVIWYFFSRALRSAGVDASEILLSRLGTLSPSTALERALACRVKQDWAVPVGEDEIRPLLAEQLPSGGWPYAPFYKGGRVRWGSEELTTGICLEALHAWAEGTS